jgi:hypothetical protein
MEHPASVRARVFISCGQAKNTDEAATASKIRDRLLELGFDPYIAIEEQSLRGLTDNIFKRLRTSEYFVFIDFKREKLACVTPTTYRGSLFSHQELAVAQFLNLEVAAFQENGVKQDDGIIRFLQVNAIHFTDRHTLANVVGDTIVRRKWKPDWRNELTLERDKNEFTSPQIANLANIPAKCFHIDIRNRHLDRFATNCYVYLEKAVRLGPSADTVHLKTVELKWAGTMFPSVGIGPGSIRTFDAFFILPESPTVLRFSGFMDASDYHPHIQGEGEYELSYLVTASNFPVARRSFKLKLDGRLALTTLSGPL